jgi:hypothetical protein
VELKSGYLNSLRFLEYFALRLGDLSFDGWYNHPRTGQPTPKFKQKGVDMKIGLDIAWMASKRTVDVIVLVAGDSDFISPIKLARREGIQVGLCSFSHGIKPELKEHVDFILSVEYLKGRG